MRKLIGTSNGFFGVYLWCIVMSFLMLHYKKIDEIKVKNDNNDESFQQYDPVILNDVFLANDDLIGEPLLKREMLYNILINNEVPYCIINGEYYTPNGEDVLIIKTKKYAYPIEQYIVDKDGNKCVVLTPPKGYDIIENGLAVKYDTDYLVLTPNTTFSPLSNGISDVVSSKPYSSLLERNLVLTLKKKID